VRWLCLSLLLLGCSECRSDPPVPVVTDGTWGHAPYDALVGLNDPAEALVDTDRGRALAAALERAAADDPPAHLRPEARVALQNDAWGLWQRVTELGVSSANAEALLAHAEALMRRLAVDPDPWRPAPPPAVAAALGDGFTPRESEMPSLQHERMFGNRRVFHVARRGDAGEERAFYSTLVALDRDLSPVLTHVPGELERLRFEGDTLVEARVHELDRRALRERGPAHALVEIHRVAHIPATGANRFYVELDPPAPVETLPCVQCHEDPHTMSLPTELAETGDRLPAVLELAVRPAGR